jgi:hypothetical protein
MTIREVALHAPLDLRQDIAQNAVGARTLSITTIADNAAP